MTDDADRAEQEIERELAEALRQRRPSGPQPTGFCLLAGCGEPLAPGLRWCPGTECRDEWEREQRARTRHGPPQD